MLLVQESASPREPAARRGAQRHTGGWLRCGTHDRESGSAIGAWRVLLGDWEAPPRVDYRVLGRRKLEELVSDCGVAEPCCPRSAPRAYD